MPKLKAKKKMNQENLNPENLNPENPNPNPEDLNLKPNLINSDVNDSIDLNPELDKLQELKENSEIIESEPKKKRGRKPKTETIVEPELPEIDLSPLIEIAIKRFPNPLPLTDSEKNLFNSSANKVFQKYGGGFKYIEEINLTLVLISIIYPRLKKTDLNEIP